MVNTDPLAQPLSVYLAVLLVSMCGGLVGYLNKNASKSLGEAAVVILTSAFMGFMTFCLGTAREWDMAWMLLSVGTVGLMGKRAIADFIKLFRGGNQ